VTHTEVSPTSTGDRHVRVEGRLGDDEENHAEWAAIGFIYALGVLPFAAARPRGVSVCTLRSTTTGRRPTCYTTSLRARAVGVRR
jgi:hypothetical protein